MSLGVQLRRPNSERMEDISAAGFPLRLKGLIPCMAIDRKASETYATIGDLETVAAASGR
jgi:hypothetical protein